MCRHELFLDEKNANCHKILSNNKYKGKEQTPPSTLVQKQRTKKKHACNIQRIYTNDTSKPLSNPNYGRKENNQSKISKISLR